MIIKIFLGISIICACTLIGGIKAARLKQKRDFFMGLENFLIYLKREISFSFSDISTVIRSYSSSSEDVRNLLEGFIEGSVAIPKFLSESERLFVLEFFKKIGKSDKVNELELINFFHITSPITPMPLQPKKDLTSPLTQRNG